VKAWRRAFVALLAAGLALPLCAQISVRDDRGIEQRFDAPPQRVVSLLPSLTESVCAVGACERLVGTDRYSNWPAQVQALPKLGGLDDALVERIVALKPDVVLAASSTRAVARLQALGLKVLAFDSDRHAQVRASLLALGRLFAADAVARAAWATIEAELERAAARVPPALRGKTVYFEADAAPYAAGAGSFVGETLARLQLVNIAPASMGPFPALNPEAVVRAQPQLVMAAQRNLRSMAQRPGWSGLQALKQGQVCSFDVDQYELLIRPGPRMGRAALVMADCLAALAVATATR
jgi:iron complex transport system substrate-binding protein